MQEKLYYRRISDLKGDFNSKTLILQPAYQRNFVWDIEKQSRLIESVLLDYPINPLHFSEDARHVCEVIDGQQRLMTFFRFLDGLFPLKKLKKLDELNGCYFKDLSPDLQSALKYYQIGIFPYSEKNNPDIKYEIFERLNTGSMTLNAQELRNCIFHGNYNELINRIAGSKQTKDFLGLTTKRMKDAELVLSFFAVQPYDLAFNYNAQFKNILDNELRNNRNLPDHMIALKTQQWNSFVEVVSALFKQKPFRRLTPSGTMFAFNETIYQAFAIVVPRFKRSAIFENVRELQSKVEYTMYEDESFTTMIDLIMSSSDKTIERIKILYNMFLSILGEEGLVDPKKEYIKLPPAKMGGNRELQE